MIKVSSVHRFFVLYIFTSLLLPFFPNTIGLRFDQFFLYSFGIMFFIFFGRVKNLLKIPFKFFKIITPLFFIFLISFLSHFYNQNSFQNILSTIENLINPIFLFILFIVIFYCDRYRTDLKNRLIKSLILFLIVNTIFQIISAFFDVSSIMNFYGANEEDSVWQRSYNLNRYIGFFSQPFEAGLAYSIGLLIILKKDIVLKNNFLLKFFIIVGGLITYSKFFFITLFLLFVGYFFKNDLKKVFIVSFVLIGPVIILNIDLIYDIFNLILFTRFQDGTVIYGLSYIYENHFFFGLGLVPLLNGEAFDSAYLQIFAISGIFGLILYLILLFKSSILVSNSNSQKFINLIFLIIIFFGSLGGPIFTANKANIFVITYIILYNKLYQEITNNKYEKI
jgi:hypothetical protein